MDSARIAAMAEAYERLWRERTPARDVSDVLARNRVTFSDINDWHHKTFGEWLSPLAREDMAPTIEQILRELRREFPHERWD